MVYVNYCILIASVASIFCFQGTEKLHDSHTKYIAHGTVAAVTVMPYLCDLCGIAVSHS